MLMTSPLLQDDAQYLASSYLGPVVGQMAYDVWRFKVAPNMVVTMAFTKDSCVPLVEGISFTDHGKRIVSLEKLELLRLVQN